MLFLVSWCLLKADYKGAILSSAAFFASSSVRYHVLSFLLSTIDFSLIGLRNEDIGFIVNGLLLRKELLVKDGVTLPLKLLDIRSDYITRKGITRFMYALENNSRLSDVSSDSFIFDEELIVRTNVDLSDGFKESLAEISPRISSRITFL